jgi:hypothetical protein
MSYADQKVMWDANGDSAAFGLGRVVACKEFQGQVFVGFCTYDC